MAKKSATIKEAIVAPWVFSWENVKDLTSNSIPEDTKVHMHSGHFNKLNDALFNWNQKMTIFTRYG